MHVLSARVILASLVIAKLLKHQSIISLGGGSGLSLVCYNGTRKQGAYMHEVQPASSCKGKDLLRSLSSLSSFQPIG